MSEPVPIAFCITDLDRGGAELALVQVVTRLDRDVWRPHVFCLTHRGRLAEDLEQNGIPVTCFGLTQYNFPAVLWRLRSALRNTRPAILQTYLYHANIIGRLAARLAGVGVVVSGIRVAEKRSRLRLMVDRWTDRLVSRHVCVSKGVAQFSAEQGRLPKSKLTVIPNGVDHTRFRTALPHDLREFDVPLDAFTVLFVGRLESQKAPEVLLEAVLPLLNQHPAVHVLMVGAGEMESELRDQVSASGHGGQVHFVGRQRDVAGLMRASNCLVLTSRWEGMANVVLEAMAAGLPVVATEVEGIPELLSDGRGLIVPVDAAEEVRTAVSRLIGSPELRESFRLKAQVYSAEHFTWDRVVQAYTDLYADLLRD